MQFNVFVKMYNSFQHRFSLLYYYHIFFKQNKYKLFLCTLYSNIFFFFSDKKVKDQDKMSTPLLHILILSFLFDKIFMTATGHKSGISFLLDYHLI